MLPLGKLRISPDDYVAEQMGLTMKQITSEYSRFTDPEKVTLMTLWSIFRSPLMMGGHLPENDALTLQMLTNEEVLAVNQASTRNRELLAEGKAVVWAADAADGGTYVALFNRGEAVAPVEVPRRKRPLRDPRRARPLEARAAGRGDGAVRADVEPHGAVLLKLVPKR